MPYGKEQLHQLDTEAQRAIRESALGYTTTRPSGFPHTDNMLALVAEQSPRVATAAGGVFADHPKLKHAVEDQMQRMQIHSPETYAHIYHVTGMTAKLAIHYIALSHHRDQEEEKQISLEQQKHDALYRLTEKEAAETVIAAMLHDYGKLYTPQDVLHYPGKIEYDTVEREILQRHVQHSEALMKALALPASLREIEHTIVTHHEELDGCGYPYKKSEGASAPLPHRILPIADCYEAATGFRSYRKEPMPHEKAASIIVDMASCGMKDAKVWADAERLLHDYRKKYPARDPAQYSVGAWQARVRAVPDTQGRSSHAAL